MWGERFVGGITQKQWDIFVEDIRKDVAARKQRALAKEAARQKELERIREAIGENESKDN